MASTPPLMSRNASSSCLCKEHGALAARPAVLLHAAHHRLQRESSLMRRSVSAPCLHKASRFVTAGREEPGTTSSNAASCSEQHGETAAQPQHLHGNAAAQQHHQTRAGLGAAAESRFASLSRVLLVSQPSNMFRNLANRKWPSAVGPISLLVFLFGTFLAIMAAVRNALVRKVKSCKSCKGFGVVRCRLCDGTGAVDWRAKFSYSEMCPLCAAKRFVVCPDCGGHYHRRLFSHAKAVTPGAEGGFGAPGFAGVQMPARD